MLSVNSGVSSKIVSTLGSLLTPLEKSLLEKIFSAFAVVSAPETGIFGFFHPGTTSLGCKRNPAYFSISEACSRTLDRIRNSPNKSYTVRSGKNIYFPNSEGVYTVYPGYSRLCANSNYTSRETEKCVKFLLHPTETHFEVAEARISCFPGDKRRARAENTIFLQILLQRHKKRPNSKIRAIRLKQNANVKNNVENGQGLKKCVYTKIVIHCISKWSRHTYDTGLVSRHPTGDQSEGRLRH